MEGSSGGAERRSLDHVPSVNSTLGYPKAKKPKKKESRNNWVDHYPVTLGLRPVMASSSGKVEQTVCRFCESFKREGKASVAQELDLILNGNTRKPASTIAIFDTFRKDTIVRHLKSQHPSKWAAYEKLPNEKSIRDQFFADPNFSTTILAHIHDQRGYSVLVPASIVSVIQRMVREEPIDTTNSAGVTVSITFSVFDGLVEQDYGSFLLRVRHKKQFDTIIKLASDNPSFRSITKAFSTFREAYSSSLLGHVTQEVVARSVRYAVAINLTSLRVIIEHVWGFSILVDGATHAAQGYLDMRLSFECQRKLHNVHFLAIPTGGRAHTALNYAELVLDALTNTLESWSLPKIIGVATDGKATMLGCRTGFVRKIVDACAQVGGTGITANWCGSHQLNLAVRDFLNVFDVFTNFRSTLSFEITFTRTHESVSSKIGICPEHVKTRWNSIHDSCKYLKGLYKDVIVFQSQKDRQHSSEIWWLCFVLVTNITGTIKRCFATLQGKTITIAEQRRALTNLNVSLCNKVEDGSNGSSPTMSKLKTEVAVCASSPFAVDMYRRLPLSDRQQLVLTVMDAVTVLIKKSIDAIQTEVLKQNTLERVTWPAEIINCADSTFSQLLDAHSERLREQFGATIVTDIWDQRNALRDECKSRSKLNKNSGECQSKTVRRSVV